MTTVMSAVIAVEWTVLWLEIRKYRRLSGTIWHTALDAEQQTAASRDACLFIYHFYQ